MKKKILATLMLSTVVLNSVGTLTVVKANDTDSQIAAQDEKINAITEQQATAQAEVDSIQAQVDSILAEQESLTAENARLEAESQTLSAEIERLSADIVSRDQALQEQARSAQTDGSATSYINVVLDSKSIVDAVSRVNAMREIVAANNRMLEQQKADKEAIAEKQKANQEAINTVYANRQQLEDDAQTLQVRQAELETAKLNLAIEKATAEDEKAALIEQKAAAEAAAAAAAAAQQAYAAEQAALAQQQQESVAVTTPVSYTAPASTTTTTTTTASTPASSSASSASTSTTTSSSSSAAVSNSRYDASSYPVGECTWGVKSQVSWVGPYWGDAKQWVASARAEGFSVGTTPQVGAIAVWTGGYYGHVALVIAVESSSNIQVSESNYMGRRYIGNHRGWFNPTTTSEGAVYYIYP